MRYGQQFYSKNDKKLQYFFVDLSEKLWRRKNLKTNFTRLKNQKIQIDFPQYREKNLNVSISFESLLKVLGNDIPINFVR